MEKLVKNIMLKLMKLILLFMSIMKKIKIDKDGHNRILFKIDIYFPEYNLAAEIDQKGHTDRYLVAENKRQEALKKRLDCKFIRINTSKEDYDANYEIGRT